MNLVEQKHMYFTMILQPAAGPYRWLGSQSGSRRALGRRPCLVPLGDQCIDVASSGIRLIIDRCCRCLGLRWCPSMCICA